MSTLDLESSIKDFCLVINSTEDERTLASLLIYFGEYLKSLDQEGINKIIYLMDKNGCLDRFEELQTHESSSVRDITRRILENYLGAEEDDIIDDDTHGTATSDGDADDDYDVNIASDNWGWQWIDRKY